MAEQKKIIMPSASFIVARSYPDFVIGCENKLPWKLRTDMQRFRKLTDGHVVIMGRKTLESIGRPLPNRINIILSKGPSQPHLGGEWVTSVEDAIFLADFYSICSGTECFYVIGGDQIYKAFYDRDLYNRIYLTEVFCEVPNGDAFFPYSFDRRQWKLVEEQDHPASEFDEFPFRFTTFDKKSKTVRTRFKSEFLTSDSVAEIWRKTALAALDRWEQSHPVQSEQFQQDFQFAS